MILQSRGETALAADISVLRERHERRSTTDPYLGTRLNQFADYQPTALLGVLEFWMAPCGESQFDVKN